MNSIQSLWTEAKTYLELQKEYLKLDSAEKLSVLGGVMLIIIIIILLLRKRWIVQPIARFVAKLFISEDEEEDDDEPLAQ